MRLVVLLVFIVPGTMGAPLLHAVVPDLPGPGPGDEGFAIDANGTDLAGYFVTDGEGTWMLPSCTDICWFTGNESTWTAYNGPPATEWNSSKFVLANNADSFSLLDPDGNIVDEVAWGADTNLQYGSPGVMYMHSNDGWVTPRIHRIGESSLQQPTFTVDHLTLYTSPDSSYGVLTDLMAAATNRLQLHVHDLSSPALIESLVRAANDIDVDVLVDGRVPGRSNSDERELAGQWARIVEAGSSVVVAEGGRYAHHHLKVLIVDDAVAIQSENWNDAGVPADPTWGNRGWGIVVHDASFADWMAYWMEVDRQAWDVVPLEVAAAEPAIAFPNTSGNHHPVPATEMYGSFQLTPIISPDHTASQANDLLVQTILEAEERVWTQQLKMAYSESNYLGWNEPDRFTSALQAAAQRRLDTRAILAGPFAFEDVTNAQLAFELQGHGVDAAMWDHPSLGILHNKGWVIDDAVYVGSMNGNHASRSANREVGVLIDDARVANWYAAQFLEDSAASDHFIPAVPVPILLAALLVARLRRTH